MFYSQSKTEQENKKQENMNNHNRSAVLLLVAVISGLFVIGTSIHRTSKEFS